jgi:hypothetical protein
MTRPDGYVERKIRAGKDQIYAPFENTASAVHLAYTGNLDVHSERFRRFVAYVEEKQMDGYFTGKMSGDVFYMGVGEYYWHHAYLRLGEWKKAFAAIRTNLHYGMTQDTYQVQERLSGHDPAFTPWQPNGSGNGRTLDMMLNAFYFEHDGVVTLLGGIPFAWLAKNGVTALKGLHTRHGRISLEATMRDSQTCQLSLQAVDAEAMPPVLTVPDHYRATCESAAVAVESAGKFRVRGRPRELGLLLRCVP